MKSESKGEANSEITTSPISHDNTNRNMEILAHEAGHLWRDLHGLDPQKPPRQDYNSF